MTKPKYVIGIDGGVNTGYAVYDRIERKLTTVFTTDFWGAVRLLDLVAAPENIADYEVYIENPSGNAPTFAKQGAKGMLVYNKISQNVGANKREAILLIEYCRLKGIKVTPVRPNKSSMTKLSADKFQKITGYVGRTSEHSRDASMMIFGR